jgi:predicted metal-dependent enzyme (double-stranded beta helix superfamily)
MQTIGKQRRAAVAETINRIRAIEAREGVTRKSLEAIKNEVAALASHTELFPRKTFAPNDKATESQLYRLSEDSDQRFALYLNAGAPGGETPPHDHTTWAVIAGIDGAEHQKIYRRTDDRSRLGKGTVEVDREFTVEPGTAIAYMPDDIHSIHIEGDRPILHLHMYGRSFEAMTGRVQFDVAAGTYEIFPAHPHVLDDPNAA